MAVPWVATAGADAGVEELHIIARHEAYPQTFSRAVKGHFWIEYNHCADV